MSNLLLEHLLGLSLIMPFLLKLDALPAFRSNSPLSETLGFLSIGDGVRFETNDESITSGKNDDYEIEFREMPDARKHRHMNNKESIERHLDRTPALHAIDSRLVARMGAGLEKLLHDELRLQEHAGRGPSAEMERRTRSSQNNKPRRRAPHDFFVI